VGGETRLLEAAWSASADSPSLVVRPLPHFAKTGFLSGGVENAALPTNAARLAKRNRKIEKKSGCVPEALPPGVNRDGKR
jgi:hypothetical protein